MRRLLLLLIFLAVLMSPASAVLYVGYSGNPGDYNTDGTNDEVQINQAITAAASTTDHIVYLRGSHTYWIDAPILLRDNIKLTGDSTAIIKLVTNAGWGVNVPLIRGYTTSPFSTSTSTGSGYGDNVEIYGFIIDGNLASLSTQSDVTSFGDGYYSLIQLYGVDNVKVHHMTLRYGGSDGLCTRASTNVHFYNNVVLDMGHDAYYNMYSSNGGSFHDNTVKTRDNCACRAQETSNIEIYNNYIYSEHASGRTGPGIQLSKSDGNSTRAMQNINIHDNIIDTIYGSGIWAISQYNDDTKRANNIKIHHNIIKNCGYYSTSYSNAGITIHQIEAQIYNNVIDDCGAAGIQWSTRSGYHIMSQAFTNYVRNNLIMDTQGSSYDSTGSAIQSVGTDTSHNWFITQYNDIYNNEAIQSGPGISISNCIYVAPQVYEGIGQGMRYSPYSKYGRSTGAVWVIDSSQSPLIDAGTPYSSTDSVTWYDNEPEDNGNRINIGRWGGTSYASKSGGGSSTNPPIIRFTVPSTSTLGADATISWAITGATSASISPTVGTLSSMSGSTTVSPLVTTTYTLTAIGPGGTSTDSKTMTIIEGPPGVNLHCNKTTSVSGTPVKMWWDITGTATDAWFDQGIGNVSIVSGSSIIVYPTSTTTYKLYVKGPGGTRITPMTVTVSAAPVYPTITSFTVNDSSIYSGDSALLNWVTSKATSVSLDEGIGNVSTSGIRIVAPSSNTTYTLTATNANGSVTRDVSVYVLPTPVEPEAPVNVLDTRIKSSIPTTNYKDMEWMDVGAFDPATSAKYRDLVWINTSMYAPGTIIDDAKLNLYWYYTESRTNPTVLEVYRPAGWDINTVTWNNKNASAWSNPGGDWYDKNGVLQGSDAWATYSVPIGSPTNSYIQLDVTDLVQAYVNGSYANTGFLIKSRNEANDYIAFRSTEYGSGPYLSVSEGPVSIVNPSPTNAEFGLLSGSSQEFSVGLSKAGDVGWYLNGTLVRSDDMVSGAQYTKQFISEGVYTVEARTCTDSRVWTITVTETEPEEPPVPYIPEGNAWVAWDGNDTTGNGSMLNPYATIGKALELPFNGSLVINVKGGNYNENAVVTADNITITSYSGIASFNGSGTAFNVTEKTNFSIEDICIGGYDTGILVDSVSGFSVTNVSIEDSSQSVVVVNSSSVTILDGNFSSVDGMDISGSEDVVVSGNNFSGSIGVVLYEDTNVTVTDNDFQSSQSSIRLGSVYGFEAIGNILGGDYGYEFESGNQYEPLYLNVSGDSSSFDYLYLFNVDSSEQRNVTRVMQHNSSDVAFRIFAGFNGTWQWTGHGALLKEETTQTPSYDMSDVQDGDGVLSSCTVDNDSYQIWWQKEGEYVEPPFNNEGANVTDFSPVVLQFNVSVGARQYFSVTLDGTDNIKWYVNNNLLRYRENVTNDEFRYRADDLGWYNITVMTAKSVYTWDMQVVR